VDDCQAIPEKVGTGFSSGHCAKKEGLERFGPNPFTERSALFLVMRVNFTGA
jgi:hypothetical protein